MQPRSPSVAFLSACAQAAEGLALGGQSWCAEAVIGDATGWANRYWAGSGYVERLEDPNRDLVRTFVFFAALRHARTGCLCCEPVVGRWAWFLEQTLRDVAMALKRDPPPLFALEHRSGLRSKAERDLSDHIQSLPEPPNVHWLEQIYKGAFTLFRCKQPDGLPDWWDSLLGASSPAPNPFDNVSPPTLAAPSGGPVFPDLARIDQFVDEECQRSDVLRRILRQLGAVETQIRRADGVVLTALEFLYLRYRNSPAAPPDEPTPNARELAKLLNEQGCVTEQDGESIKANYLDQIKGRLRDAVLELVEAEVVAGRLQFAHDNWRRKVFPRPNWYTDGILFPPLR